jgi:hypothetical protein
MTSSFTGKYGQSFDTLFVEGTGTQTFGIIDSDGVDVGQKYLPVSDGDPAEACGFLDKDGTDIGNLLCKPGTNWTHAVSPKVFYITEVLTRWEMFAATKTAPYDKGKNTMGFIPLGGSISPREGAATLFQIYSMLFVDDSWGYSNILSLDGITDGEYWNVTRMDTKVTHKVKAYRYTSLVYGRDELTSNEGYGSYEECLAGCLLRPSDEGKTVYFKITKA